MTRPSDARLVGALSTLGLTALAREAERGDFNDFSGAYEAPKAQLVRRLRVHAAAVNGVRELIRMVQRGDFNSDQAEADEWLRSREEEK